MAGLGRHQSSPSLFLLSIPTCCAVEYRICGLTTGYARCGAPSRTYKSISARRRRLCDRRAPTAAQRIANLFERASTIDRRPPWAGPKAECAKLSEFKGSDSSPATSTRLGYAGQTRVQRRQHQDARSLRDVGKPRVHRRHFEPRRSGLDRRGCCSGPAYGERIHQGRICNLRM